MSITVIIPSAGSGKRMGQSQKKQFLTLEGLPIVIRTLKAFEGFDAIAKVMVVTAKEDMSEMKDLIKKYKFDYDVVCVCGGKERQDSVYNALVQVDTSYVMVHDGARPFVSKDIIHRHIEAVKTKAAIITAIKVKDTIKEVHDHKVTKTLNREILVQVQTPQSFETPLLKAAYDFAKEKKLVVTDDASVVEAYGEKVWVEEGSALNIKVTLAEDLLLGSHIIRSLGCE